MKNLSEVLRDALFLSKAEQMQLVAYLTHDKRDDKADKSSYIEDKRFSGGRYCVYCAGSRIKRRGHTKNGSQRFQCLDCNKSFTPTTNTIMAKSKISFETVRKYIDCMMNGFSVRKSAEICGIHKDTAFRWRHKILDALQNMADSVSLAGIIEADETFFAVSYKGNHKNSKTFTMPRKARRRGKSSRKRGLSTDKVCVPCAINRNGLSIAKMSNLGKVSSLALGKVLNDRIGENSVLCTDKEKSYNKLSESNHLVHFALKEHETKNGIYNIQSINSYHSRLKSFMRGFNGVASKYLNNYLIWHNFVNYAKECIAEKRNILLGFVLTTDKTSYGCKLSDRPALPILVA